MTDPASKPTVVLVLWGDLFEDFYDTIDVSLERFRTEFTGSWMFAYIAALETAGVSTVLLAYSAQVARLQRFTHLPSGTEVVVIPAPRRHRWARSLHRHLDRRALRSVASYLSLPILATLRELRYWDARAILIQEYEHARFDLLVLLGKVARIPVFATFQSGNAPLSKLERPVRPYAARTAAGLIIAPHAERDRVHRAYDVPRSQIHPIPNTFQMRVDNIPDRKEARASLQISNGATVIVWHGRVSINAKGLDVLLDAWERVCGSRDGQELLLLLVGSGADAPRLHAEIALRTIDNIKWRDQFLLDRNALLPYLCAADIYVLPSRHEGFPVAPIEAMAVGLPVVAADASGVCDIFEDGEQSGGVVVPRDDPGSLAIALGRLIDDSELRQAIGKRAQARALERYSLDVVGAQLRQVLLGDDQRLT